MKKLSSIFLIVSIVLSMFGVSVSAAGSLEGVLHRFEETDAYRSWILLPNGAGKSSISGTSDTKHSGNGALEVKYQFQIAGELEMAGFVAKDYSKGIPVPGVPKFYGMWVYGNNTGNNVTFYIFDSTKESLAYKTKIDWLGWKYVEFDISKPVSWSGGDGNGKVSYPISFFQVVTSKDANMENGSGSLFFDDLCFNDERVVPLDNTKKDIVVKKYETKFPQEITGNITKLIVDDGTFMQLKPEIKRPDYAPYWLNDGELNKDVNTSYKSKANAVETEKEWVQFELPVSTNINEVVLTPVDGGAGFPKDLKISISEDAEAWTEVVAKTGLDVKDNTPISLKFKEANAKFVRLSAETLSLDNEQKYTLQLQEVGIYNDTKINFGRDINGAVATASSSAAVNDGVNFGKSLGAILATGAKEVAVSTEYENSSDENVTRAIDYLIANGVKVLFENITPAGEAKITDAQLITDYISSINNGDKTIKIGETSGVHSNLLFDKQWNGNSLCKTLTVLSTIFEGECKQEKGIMVEAKGLTDINVIENQDKNLVISYNGKDSSDLTINNVIAEKVIMIDPVLGTLSEVEYAVEGKNTKVSNVKCGEYPMLLYVTRNASEMGDFSTEIRSKLELATALFVGSNISYVKGVKTAIDKENPEVMPKIIKDKTMVPLRFIAEATGANVNWSSISYTATIEKGDTTLKVVPGSNTMIVNKVPVYIEQPAITENGRIYVPLRNLVELLDMNLFWDDSGLIIISNQKYLIDKYTDKELINQLVTTKFN